MDERWSVRPGRTRSMRLVVQREDGVTVAHVAAPNDAHRIAAVPDLENAAKKARDYILEAGVRSDSLESELIAELDAALSKTRGAAGVNGAGK